MNLLAVPNWSFGRNSSLLREFGEILAPTGLDIHYLRSDTDHNRTVSAFSGDGSAVQVAVLALAAAAFDTIDLNHHLGVHPRIGALDVCPFYPLDGDMNEALAICERTAATLAGRFEVPVFLYEKSERGRHEADLPSLRKGGFGGLIDRELSPDFGPSYAHPRLGVTVMGVRDFLIAFNVDLAIDDPALAIELAREIRSLRADGDSRFLGVRALGFGLASRGLSQVSMNLTLPDLVSVDPIVEWIAEAAAHSEVAVVGTELIGVIRDIDVPEATRLKIAPEQIIRLA